MRLRFFEFLLIFISLFLTLVSGFMYVSDISLRKYILGWPETKSQEKVGELALLTDGVKRKQVSLTEFETVSQSAPLYNYDTVVTGSEGGATIALSDGSQIQLGPNTMVRLEFESRLSFEGIKKQATVNIVEGSVSGTLSDSSPAKNKIVLKSRDQVVSLSQQAKRQDTIKVESSKIEKPRKRLRPPTATNAVVTLNSALSQKDKELSWTQVAKREEKKEESPKEEVKPEEKAPPKQKVFVKLIYPQNGALVAVAKGSTIPSRTIKAVWSFSQPEVSTHVKVLKKGTKGNPVFEKTVPIRGKQGSTEFVLKEPGDYTLSLTSSKESKGSFNVDGHFRVPEEYEGIQLEAPLIAGAGHDTTEKIIKNFSVTFQWKPYHSVTDYLLEIFQSKSANKAFFQKQINGTEYKLGKEIVFRGDIFYKVTGFHPSGFRPASIRDEFHFDLMPPVPAIPKADTVFSVEQLKKDGAMVVFTWQSTKFTDHYAFELSDRKDFRKILSRKSNIAENFHMVKVPLKPGTYYWRLRGTTEGQQSKYSRVSEYVLTP